MGRLVTLVADSEVFVIGVLARYHLDSWPVSRLAADGGNASNA